MQRLTASSYFTSKYEARKKAQKRRSLFRKAPGRMTADEVRRAAAALTAAAERIARKVARGILTPAQGKRAALRLVAS